MFPRTSELIGEPLGEPEPLDGGITNRNFRVRTGSGDYVIRLFGKETSQLGIDRRAEQAASEAAAAVGVGAEVIAFLDDAAIARFIDGRPSLPRSCAPRRVGWPPRCAPCMPAARCRRSSTPSASWRTTASGRAGRRRRFGEALERAARSSGADGARARAGALPQRPAERELHPRRRAHADRGLGVRRHGRPLLRPRQLRGQQRARRGGRRARCWRPTSASPATRRASPRCA